MKDSKLYSAIRDELRSLLVMTPVIQHVDEIAERVTKAVENYQEDDEHAPWEDTLRLIL